MGEHIVRREPPTRPSQPIERRPTAELPEQQLHQLIHNPINDDLEIELELIDAHPMVFPESTPESLPSAASARFAHTLRRDLESGPVPVVPALPPLPPRTGISTVAMPRTQRPSPPVTAMPRTETSTLAETEIPSSERPTLPSIPRFAAPAIGSANAGPRLVMGRQGPPPIDTVPSEPRSVAAAPTRSVRWSAGRTHLIPIMVVLLGLGAMAFLLLR